ncbi:aldo-keto reductase family 1 member B7-like [Saccostrea echinata]|uniref:aldo-keto reductase family 1 member B7-like n=1 Tax=Saccostrea echinata TaxID=191078 RepID=UPI002A825A2D|nr:aldo-keto reductase family 1 member B7-like [Saccostrea echinata]
MEVPKTSIKLNNGENIPVVGLGTWQCSKDEVQTAVHAALDVGYRHIDTAFMYQNEDAIGEILQDYMKRGKVKREDLFIVTKLPPTHMDPSLVKRSLEMSLKNLKLSYVDLYLVHLPCQLVYDGDDNNLFPQDENGCLKADPKSDLIATWKAMEHLVDLGLTKSIGVSNFLLSQVERICSFAKHKPVVNQVECHIYFQQKKLYECCKKLGVVLTAYSPLGSPKRMEGLIKANDPVPLEDPLIVEIAKEYGKTPAQILIRNLMQREIVVIPKSVHPERIRSNFDVFNFSLSEEDMQKIAAIRQYPKLVDFTPGLQNHPECPWEGNSKAPL